MISGLRRAAGMATAAALAVGALAAGAAQAAALQAKRYYLASMTDNALVLLDWESVRRQGNMATARVIFALRTPRDNASGRQHAFLTGVSTFDCAGNRSQVSGTYRSDVDYQPVSEPDGVGEWSDVPPGSAVAKMAEVVCDTSTARADGFITANPVEVRTRFLKGDFSGGQ